jgi:hypothetical protein
MFGVAALPAQSAAASSVPAPVLTAPADSTSTPLKDVVLKWQPVAGASQYQVQVSPNGAWTNNTVGLPGNGKTVTNLFEVPISLPHDSYFWRVRADVGGVWGPFSAPRQFLREWEAAVSILKQPTSADPTITWAPVTDASEYAVTFSTHQNFPESDSESCFTNNTSFTPYDLETTVEKASGSCFGQDVLSNGKSYFWRVIPLDDSTAPPVTADSIPDTAFECGQAQPECDATWYVSPTSFVFQATAADTTPPAGFPAMVTGLTTTWHTTSATGTPCDSTTACPTTPTFSWDPVAHANYYQVAVARDPDFSNIYRVYNTAWPELTPRDSFFDAQAGHAFYWRVSAGTCENSAGDKTCAQPAGAGPAASCPTGSGTSNPAISAVSASPTQPDGAVLGGTQVTVTLTGSNFAATPCVEGGGGGTISNVVFVSSTKVTFDYDAPTGGGKVTFDVVNPDGSRSQPSPELTVDPGNRVVFYEQSAIQSFDKASGAVSLSAPANNATAHGRSITFSWRDYQANGSQGSYDARNYELQVSRSSSFSSTVIDKKDIDLTQYTDPSAVFSDGSYFWRVAAIDESDHVLTWSAARQVTVDATGPSVRFLTKSGVGLRGPLVIRFSDNISGVNASTVRVVLRGQSAAHAVAGRLALGGSPRTYVFTPKHPLITGGTYVLNLSPSLVDANGNPAVVTGGGVRTTTVASDNSPGWSFSSGWHKHAASGALSGSYKSASAGHSATLQVVGTTAKLYACKGPHMGSIRVTVGGHSTTVSEHQSFTRCGQVVWHKSLLQGPQTIRVAVVRGEGNLDEVRVR